jgi:hypothetical protein
MLCNNVDKIKQINEYLLCPGLIFFVCTTEELIEGSGVLNCG